MATRVQTGFIFMDPIYRATVLAIWLEKHLPKMQRRAWDPNSWVDSSKVLLESVSRGLVPGTGVVFAARLTPISGSIRNEKMVKKAVKGSLFP